MAATPTALSCPTCGAPLPEQVRTQGHARCLFCDVHTVYRDQQVSLASGAAPTPVQRSVGRLRRYGTIGLAPLLGFSACALLNLQRQFAASEEIINTSVLLGVCVIGLMLLHRWVVAGIWILFISLTLLMERAIAFQEIHPVAHFSFTAEVTLTPLIIVAAFWTVYGGFLLSIKDLAHEQLKLGWRGSVAVMFVVGLLVGFRYYAQPYSGELYQTWSWAYASEMQRLTRVQPSLEGLAAALPRTVSADPLPEWRYRHAEESNLVFLPLGAIDLFPSNLYRLGMRQTLLLTGRYRYNMEEISSTLNARAYFTPVIAAPGWREQLERPLKSAWVVLYDSQPDRLRFWLLQRQFDEEVYGQWTDSALVPVGYREAALPLADDDSGVDRERDWLLTQLAEMTGGSFRTE